ncbi:hypothetical protein MMC25_006737 [Agyrium rufum]|nr:hypothetical protein [Agyrium rufum]
MALPIEAPVEEDVRGFSVTHQRVFLDFDLRKRRIVGKTDLTIQPESHNLKAIRLNTRQCWVQSVTVSGKQASTWTYDDPYQETMLHGNVGVHQYHLLQEKLAGHLEPSREDELVIQFPKNFRMEPRDLYTREAQELLVSRADGSAKTPTAEAELKEKTMLESYMKFKPFTVAIEFVVEEIRDGLHFVGWNDDDVQYPHVYTRGGNTRSSSCVFPCIDTADARCTWDISIKCARTLGDAYASSNPEVDNLTNGFSGNGEIKVSSKGKAALNNEEKNLELLVVCSGDITDEIIDPLDNTKRTTTFNCSVAVAAQHIAFAIGPFEYVNLAEFRELDEEEKLGQNAIPVHGFCLPRRSKELKNTCLPLAKALDYFTLTYGSYPFSSYKVCFVDDMIPECIDGASLSLCTNRLLFPEDVMDPIYSVTRKLVHALASQWMGVNIIAKEPTDLWIVIGISYFITDQFMRKLAGNNEYRYQQKMASDRTCELDMARPSIFDMGPLIGMDPSQLTFMSIKAPLVLFILDRRLAKASGSAGLSRIVSRVFLNAKVGDLANGAVNTAYFTRTCEKLGHAKLDTFFNQWVYGAGCPRFSISQRFNKKKLVVEMLIVQKQGEMSADRDVERDSFSREVKEELRGVYAGPIQPSFTGPMTIRIHEADGTPYEHIVEIKEVSTKFEIPYNTKYKRLKRNRKQRERNVPGVAVDYTADGQEDTLLYCLGDKLTSPEEMQAWRLAEWGKEDEDRMDQESYEWIRMDADFEWICKMTINMPGYMFVSQLQQDRDVIAQLESIQFMEAQREHALVSTFLIRTLMDTRYFHGIRTTAAAALPKHAKPELDWLGWYHLEKAFEDFFCLPDSKMTRNNDFTNRASYYVQCTIPKAMARIRDNSGKSPLFVRKFLYEKLKYNNNAGNQFSDSHFVAILMESLAETLATIPPPEPDSMDVSDETDDSIEFHHACLEEIDRHRRLDQWIPSYHNILSSTALKCKARLMRAAVIPTKSAAFLQYTQPGCFEDLRLQAFQILTDLGLCRHGSILRWFLFVLSSDPSPYIRENMHQILARFFGSIAIGEDLATAQLASGPSDGLIIEQEATTDSRQAELARKQTILGAMTALRNELGKDDVLKAALWEAVESPLLTVHELGELLEICSILYEPIFSQIVVLQYPRYVRLINQGKKLLPRHTSSTKNSYSHIITFQRTSKIRTKPRLDKIQPSAKIILSIPSGKRQSITPAPKPAESPSASMSALLYPGLALPSSGPSQPQTKPPTQSSMSPPPQRTILKLKKPSISGASSSSAAGHGAQQKGSPSPAPGSSGGAGSPMEESRPKLTLKLKLGQPK